MKKLHATRLTKLYNLMLDLPEKYTFDMACWQTGEYEVPAQTIKEVECDTSCCAAGWGVLLIPDWNKNLKFGVDGNIIKIGNENESEYDVLATFLDITELESKLMFNPDYYNVDYIDITPELVATRIQHILEDNGYALV